MGFRNFLARIAKSFQPAYDKIDAMDFPPEIKEKLQQLADVLPEKIKKELTQKVLWFCTTAMKKYGKKFVQSTLNIIVDFLKTSVEGISKRKEK